ncbi:MAG: FecR family protein [Rikenellaceae bacterium]
MKKLDKKEIEELSKYREITLMVADILKNKHKEGGFSLLDGNRYKKEFLSKISSEEEFKKQSEILEIAYQKRNPETLVHKLKEYNRRNELRRRRVLTAVCSAVAMVAAVTFYIFAIEDKTFDQKYKNEIFVPTLISNNLNTVLDTTVKRLIVNEYDTAVVRAQSEAVHEHFQLEKLVVPKGFTYEVELCDGTLVSLNAKSELHFPNRFGEHERVVTLMGEGYFKVKKSTIPFIVKVGDMYVKVYGTTFNINAREMKNVQTILVEGAVGVGLVGGEEIRMKPDEMVLLNTTNGHYKKQTIDPQQYIGWVNGYFRYINKPLSDLFDEMSRWYGIEINYDREFTVKNINISLEHDMKLEEAMKFIERIMKIKFIRENDKKYKVKKMERK